MQSEIQQQNKIWATHTHKKNSTSDTSQCQKCVIKGAGQQIQQWAIWTKQHFITYSQGLTKRKKSRSGKRWRDYLHFKLDICHANKALLNWKYRRKRKTRYESSRCKEKSPWQACCKSRAHISIWNDCCCYPQKKSGLYSFDVIWSRNSSFTVVC